MNGDANWPFSTHVSLLGLLNNMFWDYCATVFWDYCVTVFFIYCISIFKNVSLNSVVRLMHVEADIYAVCFYNTVGNSEWFVPEEVLVVVHSLLGMGLETLLIANAVNNSTMLCSLHCHSLQCRSLFLNPFLVFACSAEYEY